MKLEKSLTLNSGICGRSQLKKISTMCRCSTFQKKCSVNGGFKITHFELAEQFGTMVQLSYYFNQMQHEILDFRSGFKRPTKKVKKAFSL